MKMTLHIKKGKTLLIFMIWLLFAAGAFAQTWTQKTSFGAAGDAGFAFTVNNKIYMGGISGRDFWQYDPAANAWTQKADMPGVSVSRGFAVGFAINGKGYVATGADGSASAVKKDLWEYDPASDTWTQKADMPGPARDGAFGFAVNGKGYLGGGFDGASGLLNDFYAYDPATNTWSAKATCPSYIIFPFAFAIGSKGYMSSGAASTESTATYEYDPATDTWNTKAPFPGTPRQAGFAFVLNNKAYCGMGMSAYTTVYKDYFSYDPAADAWTSEGDFPGAGRAWVTTAVAAGKAYVGTGWDFGAAMNNDWWEFAVVTGLNDPSKGNVIVYPNPATNKVRVRLSEPGEATYLLCNLAGQRLMSGILPPDGAINISALPQGQYQLEIRCGKQIQHSMLTIASE